MNRSWKEINILLGRRVKAPPKASIQASEGSTRVQPNRWRRLHLGLDFGTCWSKLVLRDYEAPEDRCIVVVPTSAEGGDGDFRIPSLVALKEGRLHFGFEAAELAADPEAQVFHSLKIRAVFSEAFHGHAIPTPEGLSVDDLATLVLLYLLQIAESTARRYTKPFGSIPRISMTTGAPIDYLNQDKLQEAFIRIARTAYDAFRATASPAVQRIHIRDARQVLLESRERLKERGPVTAPREWVRSEAEAALLWSFFSPDIGQGLYASVDIGAGSTDATFFRITQQYEEGLWRKAGMAFFGATARPPGMDAIGEVISRTIDVSLPLVRGHEGQVFVCLGAPAVEEIRACEGKIAEIYRDAFRRGYHLDKRASAWRDYGLFIIGGGSKFEHLGRQLRGMSVWEGQLPPGKFLDPGRPSDLQGLDGRPFHGDPTFLLVAYGLSHLAAEVPPVSNPQEIPPLRIQRPTRWVDQDEWYPK